MSFIKKFIASALSLLLLSNTAFAIGLNSDIGIQNYTTLEGSVNVVPIDTTYESGSNTTRWAKTWTVDLDVSGVFTFGGMMGSNLDMDGYNLILDTDGDTALVNDRDATLGDDEFAFDIAGARDFKWAANLFTILAGSNQLLEDATAIKSGSDSDWVLLSYDEANDDVLLNTTAKVGSQNIDYGMYQIATDTGNASMTADQEIFEIGKGAARAGQVGWSELLALDEDGDLGIAGAFAPLGGIALNDDIQLNQGTGLDYGQLYETADANALEMVYYIDKTKDANNVPVFVYGDETALNKDLGLFNGVTNPTIAVVSDDATKALYLQHNGTNGVVNVSSGSLILTPTTSVTGALIFSSNGLYSSATSSWLGFGGFAATDTFFTYDETTAQFGSFLGSASGRQFIIGEATYNVNAGAYDYDHAVQSNPTLYLQSVNNPNVDNRQWVKWYNDGSNSYHLTGIGGHRFGFEAIGASGIMSFSGNLTAGDVFTIGATPFTAGVTFAVGANLDATIDNIVTAINASAEAGNVTAIANPVGASSTSIIIEYDATGIDGNTYNLTETTDAGSVFTFQGAMVFTGNPSSYGTAQPIVFTVGGATLTGVWTAPGANQFLLGGTLSETMDSLTRAWNALANGIVAIHDGNNIYYQGTTIAVNTFTETTDTDNVYSFTNTTPGGSTTLYGGRVFSAFMDMQPTYQKLTKQGTATVGTTTYSSQYLGLMASGWDTDGSGAPPNDVAVARDVEFRFQTNASTGTGVNGTLAITHWRDGVLTATGMTLNSAGTVTFAGNVNSTNATFTTTASTGLTVKGNDADDASAIGVTLDNGVTLTTAGGKLVSFKNNTVEKAYIDYLGNFYAVANKALIIGVEDQSDLGNTAGVGLSILADDGGGLAAGVANGGGITITAGDAGGSTGNGAGGIVRLYGGAKVNSGQSGYVAIGNGTPTNLLSVFNTESLYVDGYFEVNNASRFNSTATFSTRAIKDDSQDLYGTGNDALFQYNTTQTTHSLVLGLSADSNAIIIAEKADFLTPTLANFGLGVAQTNPTIAIQSADATKTYEGALYTYSGITMRTIGAVTTNATNFTIAGQDGGTATTGGVGGSISLHAGDAKGTGDNIGGGIVLDLGVPTGTGAKGQVEFMYNSTPFGYAIAGGASSTSLAMVGAAADGVGVIGEIFGAMNNLTQGTLISFRDNLIGGAGGTELASIDYSGKGVFTTASVQVKRSTANVSNPPTDAELDSAFGDPTVVGTGFVGVLDDNDDGTAVYWVYSTGTAGEWYWVLGTKAL